MRTQIKVLAIVDTFDLVKSVREFVFNVNGSLGIVRQFFMWCKAQLFGRYTQYIYPPRQTFSLPYFEIFFVCRRINKVLHFSLFKFAHTENKSARRNFVTKRLTNLGNSKRQFMRLCIDEQGVYALFWYAPLKEKETVLPSATLLPFEKIMEIFRKYVWIKEKPWLILDESIVIEQDYPSDMVVTVDRITLSLQRVMEPNSFDTALLVPVWNFWGTETTTRTDLKTRKTTEEQRNAWPPTPVLSINAIDGSVIDPMTGY